MKLYRTQRGAVLEQAGALPSSSRGLWDELIVREDLPTIWANYAWGEAGWRCVSRDMLPPIGYQEVWAAGVTYYRSRNARMEESKTAGGGDFYDRVYHAERPELFFKATAHRVVGPGDKVAIREDARWSVPEPELALFISPGGNDCRLHHWQRHELPGY